MENVDREDAKIYESLFILFKCKEAVNNLLEKLGNDTNFKSGFEYSDTPLLHHIILEVVSFCEEYDSYFNQKFLPKYKDRINQSKDICKPILKEIRKWKLKEFRNNIIAHTWRSKNKFAHPDSEHYMIPKNPLEYKILVNYLNYIWSLLEVEFTNELSFAMQYMIEISNFPKRDKDYSDLNALQVNLVDEVNIKCLEYKKNYSLKVYLYDFSDVRN